MIQFYRWTLSFPPLEGPQNPRAVRLVNKLIGNTTCTTCLKPLFGKNDHFASPRQPLTGLLRIFPGLCLTFLPSAARAVASDFCPTYFLKVCIWAFLSQRSGVHGCQQASFPVASVAHLMIWGRAGGSKMTEISNGVFSKVYISQKVYFVKFDDLWRCWRQQDARDFNWRVIDQSRGRLYFPTISVYIGADLSK